MLCACSRDDDGSLFARFYGTESQRLGYLAPHSRRVLIISRSEGLIPGVVMVGKGISHRS